MCLNRFQVRFTAARDGQAHQYNAQIFNVCVCAPTFGNIGQFRIRIKEGQQQFRPYVSHPVAGLIDTDASLAGPGQPFLGRWLFR